MQHEVVKIRAYFHEKISRLARSPHNFPSPPKIPPP